MTNKQQLRACRPHRALCLIAASAATLFAAAQDDGAGKLTVTGSVQSDIIIPQGGHNKVAIDIIAATIEKSLQQSQ